jgi:hypothetical protein
MEQTPANLNGHIKAWTTLEEDLGAGAKTSLGVGLTELKH